MKFFAAWLVAFCVALPAHSDAGSFGTGFAISPQGVFVTCHHVVKSSQHIIVHGPNGPLPGRVVAADPANDIAILLVEGWQGRFLGLKSSKSVLQGSDVLVAGFPDPTILGRNPKVSDGIVNALSGVRDDPRLIQTSANVQPGNSGGPLVTESGQVIGIVAAGLDSLDRMQKGGYVPQAVNYAVKTELVMALLDRSGIPRPGFGTKTSGETRMIRRVLGSIALIEGIGPGERSSLIPARQISVSGRPSRGPQPARADTAALPPQGTKPATIHRSPWIFVDSHSRKLMASEVHQLPNEILWRARNEIYLRRGYIFSTEKGQRFARDFAGIYQPVTPSVDAIKAQLNDAEIHNLRLIASFEQNG